jgi:2-amino-4-hydroxy-6-hydroxymethyldihydropteridine diphosphokinase
VEQDLGRKERALRVPQGPREIDIDVLFCEGESHQSAELTVPHPRFYERAFVLVPLLELDPHLRDPSTNQPLQKILEAMTPTQSIVRLAEALY